MIKLSNIINEAHIGWGGSRTAQLRKPVFMNAATRGRFTSAREKMLENKYIFRGVKGGAAYPYYIVQPGKHYRPSRNTSNFYTGLIDGLPAWKGWPKRSRSIICSNDQQDASGFGHPLLVLPMNGAKLGICSQDDFWVSFRQTILRELSVRDMSYFNALFIGIFSRVDRGLGEAARSLTEETYQGFIQDANSMATKEITQKAVESIIVNDDFASGIFINGDHRPFEENILSKFDGDWEKYFDYLMNPKVNGFELQTIETYDPGRPSSREIWTDAVSLMVSRNYMQELIHTPEPEETGAPKPNLDITI